MKPSEIRQQFVVFLVLAGILVLILTVLQFAEPLLAIYVKDFFPPQQTAGTEKEMGATAQMLFNNIINVFKIVLWMGLIIAIVRLINALISAVSTVLLASTK